MWENTETKLRFRKFPWPHWILAFLFLGAAAFIIYMANADMVKFKKKYVETLLLLFLIVVGFVFLTSGRIKSTIFDKEKRRVTIRKRTICCQRKTITNYNLDDMISIRAVKRGIN